MIEKFINYVSSYDASFAATIRGASSADIDKAERFLGRPLPQYYASYLSRMGCDDGGLKPADESSITIDNLLRWYRPKTESDDVLVVPPDCILIALSVVFDVCLYCTGDGEPEVYQTEGIGLYQPYAESLEKLLFRTAFWKYHVRRFPHSVSGSAPPDSATSKLLIPAGELAAELGFEAQWFSDSQAICGQKNGAAIYIAQFKDLPLHVHLYGADSSELAPLGRRFRESMRNLVR